MGPAEQGVGARSGEGRGDEHVTGGELARRDAEFGDVDRMARYAIDLLGSPAKLKMFSDAARLRAVEFDSSRVVSQYEAYYERVLAQ